MDGWMDGMDDHAMGGCAGPVGTRCSELFSSGRGPATSRDFFFDLLGDYCLLGSCW